MNSPSAVGFADTVSGVGVISRVGGIDDLAIGDQPMFFLLLSLAISGLIIGALGRLLVPGPNPMGLMATAGVGLGGGIVGGLIGHVVIGWRYRYSYGFGFILSVLAAAGIVVLVERSRRRSGG
ncbi:MAG TPA: hypothetical protein VG368_07455 [Acidimicrobiales bacterium]|nr:hypothetical protein [Acidimicrobiales bacterium]